MDSKQLLTLGYNYRHGIGVEKDEKKAFEHYMKAAELGSSAAMQHVSLCYYYGIGVGINYQKSFEYCKRSADLVNVHGMCSVGTRYFTGNGVDQDYNKAFECFKKSANMGNMVAMYNVANCYRNGIGTKRDIQSANYWFKKRRSLLKSNKSPGHINPELKRILDDDRFKLSWVDYNEVNVIKEWGKRMSINDDGDYIIVMGIAPKGLLRQNLVEASQLEWKDKLNILNGIVIDLESIHSQELVHRDLHSGNILQRDELQHACITDLGLLKMKRKEKFVISTGQRAFDGTPFDDYLVTRIIYGSRPKCLGPDCYIKLATK
ncbi:hypothetical protein C2G38_2174668 [Gigaspora rosea]|uniref:Protein kinase domain-containing protein n=1 Tax=Gigaspora rosea TaxID=44941 RepID=A0A397VSW1_9GLOM|nr:hypothetical protein C2G38_2174668 [Gigaspora rosea]